MQSYQTLYIQLILSTTWLGYKPLHSHTNPNERKGEEKSCYFCFFLQAFCFPPVARRLCIESREVPTQTHAKQPPPQPLAFLKPDNLRHYGSTSRTRREDGRALTHGGGGGLAWLLLLRFLLATRVGWSTKNVKCGMSKIIEIQHRKLLKMV